MAFIFLVFIGFHRLQPLGGHPLLTQLERCDAAQIHLRIGCADAGLLACKLSRWLQKARYFGREEEAQRRVFKRLVHQHMR
jgi:hypothetical protein